MRSILEEFNVRRTHKEGGYYVRRYEEGDEVELSSLFNNVYQDYAGFVPRTVEYWRWCCLSRPGVEKNGIGILERSKEIVGYAVVAVESTSDRVQATVLELCYNPSDGESTTQHLVKWILDYSTHKNVDLISVKTPEDDRNVRRVLDSFGFSEFPYAQPLLQIIDYAQLMRNVLTSRGLMLKRLNEVFHFDLLDTRTFRDNSLSVKVQHGAINVELGKTGVATINVKTDSTTFTSCIFGITDVVGAILKRRIRVRPFWKFRRVTKLLSALKLGDPWFIPGGDFG